MLHSWSRYTRENSPKELSILLCISEARENFAEQAKLGRCRAANRAAVADRRREAGNRRASGSGGAFTFDPRRAFWTRPAALPKARAGPEDNSGRHARLRIPKSSISKRSFSFQKTIDLQEENAIFHDQRRVHDRRVKTSSF
jgi:hypothetical protein